MICGLTGATGSGKTTAAELFLESGWLVIDCDRIARDALDEPGVLEALSDSFGKEIIDSDGSLIRSELAARAFKSRERTKKLNAITHPVITRLICDIIRNNPDRKILIDAPALFESGADKLCDFTVAIVASPELSQSRIKKRDGISDSMASLRINAQPGSEYYTAQSDIVINNRAGLEKFKNEIIRVMRKLEKQDDYKTKK